MCAAEQFCCLIAFIAGHRLSAGVGHALQPDIPFGIRTEMRSGRQCCPFQGNITCFGRQADITVSTEIAGFPADAFVFAGFIIFPRHLPLICGAGV